MVSFESLIERLGEADIPGNEAKVYIALLRTGPATSGEIAKAAGLHHTRTYEALERLAKKGLVSHVIKNRTKHFKAAEPGFLLSMIKRKEKRISEAVEKLKTIEHIEKERPVATVYEGKRGLRLLLDFILESLEGGEYVDFGVSGLFRDVMGPYWDAWQKTKRERKINSRVIFEDKLKGSGLHKDYFGEARFVPAKYHCPSDTIIFGGYIAVFMWTAGPPTAVLLRDKKTAEGYRNIFNWMWENAQK